MSNQSSEEVKDTEVDVRADNCDFYHHRWPLSLLVERKKKHLFWDNFRPYLFTIITSPSFDLSIPFCFRYNLFLKTERDTAK